MYSRSFWIMILITVLGTLMIGAGITVFFYCKCKNVQFIPRFCLCFGKQNPKETKAMLSGSPQPSIGYPKVKATPKTEKKHQIC